MTEYQELLLDYCREALDDPQAVQERASQIEQILRLRASNPSWFTLKPLETDGRCWRQHVVEHLQIEDYALESLGQVAGVESLGQFEVNRILAHLLKDSTSQRQAARHCPSRWLQRACTEALDAMSDWASWDAEEQRKKGLEYVHHGEDWSTNWSWEPASRPSQPSRPSHSYPRSGSSSRWTRPGWSGPRRASEDLDRPPRPSQPPRASGSSRLF